MGNCYRTPKPRRLALSQSTRLSVVPVLTISLKSAQIVTKKTLAPALELDIVTSPNSGNNTARSHRRGRSDPEPEEAGPPIDYFSGEDSRESLILTPLTDPAPKLPRHPLIPPLNLAYLKPEKTTLDVKQVQDKRSKWSKERQRGRLLLEVTKPASSSPSPESLLNAQTKSSSKESLPRPRNLLPMAQTAVRTVRSLETTPKPKPRISLPRIPLVCPLVITRRTEELGVSALTGTTIDEKSVLKNIESLPVTMSQISGKQLFQPQFLLRPLVDRQITATQLRLHARHTSLSVLKSNTKLVPSDPGCSPTATYQERSAPVKMTTKMVKTRKPDGTIEVNEYQLIREVGAGAFGRVYEARKGDQQFAIKEYNKQKLKHVLIGKHKTALDTVKEEVAILSRIEHPNIVYLYEVIDSPDSRKTYLVMEYAAKGRLQDCLPLSEGQAQGFFVQIVEAVEYLHEVVRVIHRDIKPDNILLDAQNNIKISDFGSSQTMRNPDDTFTNTPGTPAFLSPEQCGGTKEFLGKPLDIWAMGVTLYYMLFNRPPFVARRLGDLYESIKSEEVHLSRELSKELRDLLLRLLEKNPVKRIQLLELREHPWLHRPANQSYA